MDDAKLGHAHARLLADLDISTPLAVDELGVYCPCLAGLDEARIEAVALLPIHDANGQVLARAADLGPLARRLHAAVFAGDPLRSPQYMLLRLSQMGIDGVANFPTVGILDGELQTSLEQAGMGMDREVELIARAARLGMRTAAIAPSASFAEAMIAAGAQSILVGRWASPQQKAEIAEAAQRAGIPMRLLVVG